MAWRLDDFHSLGQQGPKAGPAFEHRVPARGLFVPVPIKPAQIIRHRDLRGGRQIGQAHRRTRQPRTVIDQVVNIIQVFVRQLHRLAQRF